MRLAKRHLILLAVVPTLAACGDELLETATDYDIRVSAPRFVIPSDNLPAEVEAMASNNNVDIAFHEGRLYLAWRTAPSHFASTETRMYVIASDDGGTTWSFEHVVHIDADMREPRLLSFNGFLQLLFFEAGTNPAAFEPMRIWRTRRLAPASWSNLELITDEPEVPWDLKVHQGLAYLTSYLGDHYGAGAVSDIRVFFKQSSDGTNFSLVNGAPFVYRGGVSEVAFEFDTDGSLWAVTRNEDGDPTGFGAHVCYAPAGALSEWQCSEHSDPMRYDSPEMFRHEDDIYLIARRDIGGPYDQGTSMECLLDEDCFLERKFQYLLDYSLRPKRTALYRIDKQQRAVEHLFDLPGAGDTAFPSLQQTGPHSFLVANYTSPLEFPDVIWLEGQNSPRGTQIYLLDLVFEPRAAHVATATPTATPPLPPTATPTPRGDESALPVAIMPVLAEPGVPMTIVWPEVPDLEGNLAFGGGLSFGPETTEREVPAGERILRGSGFVRSGDVFISLAGTIVRGNTLAFTPLRRFLLVEPSDPTAQGVIRTVIPAFYWAATGDTLALATDPTGRGDLDWMRVTTTPWSLAEDGSFTTAAVSFEVELSGTGATASGLFVGLENARFSGIVSDAAFGTPITMDAEIVIADVVAVLQTLGGFPEQQALEFVAGLFDFDPTEPPTTAPFRGELPVQPLP